MAFTTSAPPKYALVSGDERFTDAKSSSEERSESDLFLPHDVLHNKKRTFVKRYWRLFLEAFLLLCSLTALAVTLSHKQPLLQRQRECGRLLGQWREYQTHSMI
jgi:hypothetical protein